MTPPTPQEIVASAARLSGFTADDILGRRRTRPLAAWRQAAMTVVREQLDWSYPAIGDLFDRDHTTVIAAVQRVNGDRGMRQMATRIVGDLGDPHPHLRIVRGGAA